MEKRAKSDRKYWTLFLIFSFLLTCIIDRYVRSLTREVRKEGLSSSVVVFTRSILINMVDIETGLRGYLLTGRREYLRPYHEGLGTFATNMANLKANARDDPDQISHVAEVDEIARKILTEFANQVQIMDECGIELARKRFIDFPTKPPMDMVRNHLAAIQAEENRKIAANIRSLEVSITTTLVLLDGFSVSLFAMMIAMATGFIAPPTHRPPGD